MFGNMIAVLYFKDLKFLQLLMIIDFIEMNHKTENFMNIVAMKTS